MSGKEKTINLVLYMCVYVSVHMYTDLYRPMYVCAYASAIFFLNRSFYVLCSLFNFTLSCKLMSSVSAKGLDILLLMRTRL